MTTDTTMLSSNVPDKNKVRSVAGRRPMADKKKWIQAARERMEKKGTVGSLHKAADVVDGKKIPASKLAALKAKAKRTGNGALAKKVAFAENVKK